MFSLLFFVFQENSVKIVMVGDSGVGKSCLLGKWTKFTLKASGVDMIRIPHAFFLPDSACIFLTGFRMHFSYRIRMHFSYRIRMHFSYRIPHAFFLPDFSYILSKLNVNF